MPDGQHDDALYGLANPTMSDDCVNVTIDSGANRSTLLPAGMYLLTPTVDCYVRAGTVAIVADANDYYVPAEGSRFLFVVTGVNDYVSVLRRATDGVLNIGPQ